MSKKDEPVATVDVEGEAEEDEEEEEGEEDPSLVVEKYKCAARYAQEVLAELVKLCVPGAKVVELCALGDKMIDERCATVYKKKKGFGTGKPMQKGTASPTMINLNNIVCHYSPESSDTTVIEEGDVVRIDVGAHIDGFAAVAATTTIAGGEAKLQPVLAPKAEAVFTAAHVLQDLLLRAFRPGNTNHAVTDAIHSICTLYEVSACEGVLSHRLGKFELDGLQSIIQRRIVRDWSVQKVEEVTFEPGQAWMLDIVLSSGNGRLRAGDSKTFVFKRSTTTSQLRMKAAREVIHQIGEKFGNFPFTIRALDETRGRFGIAECLKHDLLSPYPVLYEKGGEVVCQLKSTVLITNASVERIAFVPSPFSSRTEKPLPDDMAALMTRSLSLTKKKKKKTGKAKGKKDGDEGDAEAAED